MREAGYDTFITGKWHLDAVGLQRSFKEMGPVAPGYLASTPDMYDRPEEGNNWSPSNKELFGHWLKKGLWLNKRGDDAIQHSSELYADTAVEHLTRGRTAEDESILYVCRFQCAHDPRQAPQEYLGHVSGGEDSGSAKLPAGASV